MASSDGMTWQRVVGGGIGIALLAFALVYRFFPSMLSIEPVAVGGAEVFERDANPMGFPQRGPRAQAERIAASDVGPPISLASSEVIMARRLAAGDEPVSEQIEEWLKLGDDAVDAGQLIGENSAASWYAHVLEADPGNRAARAGVAEVARRLSSAADNALDRGDFGAAERALERLRMVPLSEVEIARIEHEMDVQKRVVPMLARAADLFKQGRLFEPRGGNALDVYRAVQELDPDNGIAAQGLAEIQRVVLDRALAALAQNDLKATDAELARAAGIVPDSQALQDTRARVEGLRRRQAENIMVQARSALDGGELALAASLAEQALAISPDLPGVDDFNTRMENARLYANYRPGQIFEDRFLDRAGAAPAMVVVPAGSFTMGSAEDGPAHEVTIGRGFAIGRTEVTVAEFRVFVNASGYTTDAERLGGGSIYDERNGRLHDAKNGTWRNDYTGRSAGDNDPVLNVSWNDAVTYAKWLAQRTGKTWRLPSEAEFEYALRAGSTTRYWWGDGTPDSNVENLTGALDHSRRGRRWSHAFAGYGDGYWGPAPVMRFKPNDFGLFDMGGNLSEWVEDCWHDTYVRAPTDGRAWINPGCGTRVVRGGSWGSAPDQVRSSYRQAAAPATRSARVGFRLVREL